MANVASLSPGTWQISLPFLGESNIIGSYLLAGKQELAIIDPGPGSTYKALLTAIQEAGFAPQEVTHILLTHIHLDHAGATGTLLQHMPRAQVYVHSKGAAHLLDPSRLVASSQRIYRDRMESLWGTIEPVAQEKLHIIDDGTILHVADRRLEVHYTPGHAVHHVIFFDVHKGDLFAGDVAGVRLQDVDYVRPPTPPPDLDLEAWFASLDKIKRLRPDMLYVAHFGPTRYSTQHIGHLREKLIAWGDIVLQAMRAGKNEEDIISLLIAHTEPELRRLSRDEQTLKRYEIATNYTMTVQGYVRYWRKKHPERL